MFVLGKGIFTLTWKRNLYSDQEITFLPLRLHLRVFTFRTRDQNLKVQRIKLWLMILA